MKRAARADAAAGAAHLCDRRRARRNEVDPRIHRRPQPTLALSARARIIARSSTIARQLLSARCVARAAGDTKPPRSSRRRADSSAASTHALTDMQPALSQRRRAAEQRHRRRAVGGALHPCIHRHPQLGAQDRAAAAQQQPTPLPSGDQLLNAPQRPRR